MRQDDTNYRSHVIITTSSGFTGGPCTASYAVWTPKQDGGYELTFEGSLPSAFDRDEDAQSAAIAEAKKQLDKYLDS